MKIAVVCASGIGDALITSIASHHLLKLGNDVATFSKHLSGFGRWLEKGGRYPIHDEPWDAFDAIVLQHDNTLRAKEIAARRTLGQQVYICFTNYRPSKHGPLHPTLDYPFDENKTMVDNTCLAIQSFFGGSVSKRNCLSPPSGVSHRQFERRVLIHPTSSSKEKNWPLNRYLKLAAQLEKIGFDPLFLYRNNLKNREFDKEAAPNFCPERATIAERQGASEDENLTAKPTRSKTDSSGCFGTPLFPDLEDLAAAIYESGFFIGNDSGPAHLASYLSIPHLVIRAASQQHFWRPGWHRGELLCPPAWIPNLKILRTKWKYFITTRSALNKFNRI